MKKGKAKAKLFEVYLVGKVVTVTAHTVVSGSIHRDDGQCTPTIEFYSGAHKVAEFQLQSLDGWQEIG